MNIYWKPGGLAVLAVAAAIGLAACSGGAGTPQVASLPSNGGAGSGTSAAAGSSPASGHSATTGSATGDPTQLLSEWTSCMHSHGDPGQAEPTIDANRVIHITHPISTTVMPSGQDPTAGQACIQYLDDASLALQAGQPQQQAPSHAALVKYSACMRANGISDFPDPTGDSLQMNRGAPGGDLNPSNPAFQKAVAVCAQQTGVHISGPGGTPKPGTIDDNGDIFIPIPNGSGANG